MDVGSLLHLSGTFGAEQMMFVCFSAMKTPKR